MRRRSQDARASALADRRFAALYDAHRASIVRYLRRRLGDDAAEDASADVFLRAYRRLDTLQSSPADARPWLYGIAEYVVLERHRAERRRLRLLGKLAEQPQTTASAPAVPEGDLTPELVGALSALSSDERSALLLMAWGELQYDEIAAALGVPVGTIRSRISRARQRLRSTLDAPAATVAGGRDD